MKKETIKQFLRFAIVGGIATLMNLGLLYFSTEFLKIYYLISAILAWILSGIFNFLLNKKWTFNENIRDRTIMKYLKFSVVSIIALLFNISFLYLLTELFQIYYMLSQIMALSLSLGINFLGNKFWTFKS